MEGLQVSDEDVFRYGRPGRRDGGDALELVLTLPQCRGQFVHQREQLLSWPGSWPVRQTLIGVLAHRAEQFMEGVRQTA